MDKFKNAFKGKMHLLSTNLDARLSLLNLLRDSNLLTMEQFESLKIKEPNYNRVQELLVMLMKQPDSKFYDFCSILKQDSQTAIVEMIRPNLQSTLDTSRNPVTYNQAAISQNDALKNSFQELHKEIVSTVNVGPIIEILFAKKVLSLEDTIQLNQIQSRTEGCSRLLLLLHQSACPDAFVQLRLAMGEDVAYDFLCREIDKKCN